MGPNSTTRTKSAQSGDTRRFVVAVLGVWAMLLQLMLPFAGAIAAESGDEFWVTICTTAGIEDIYLGDGADTPGDKTSNSAGCDVCTVCACSSGAGCGCSSIKLVQQRSFMLAGVAPPHDERLDTSHVVSSHPTRAPPA